uniref:ATP synthase complex subunit 8 n=1 Tax=Latridiidae sp. 1 KM-2017 TaxID=2219441 RepID=A0A346RKF6_9CUCU|nr:ATP synthase F0 subunit 8 [Latridiidae sp. 1 KM-2017]
MPQMAPMNWLTLMMYFTLIYLIFNSINYFSFNYKNEEKSLLKKITNISNWKW